MMKDIADAVYQVFQFSLNLFAYGILFMYIGFAFGIIELTERPKSSESSEKDRLSQ